MLREFFLLNPWPRALIPLALMASASVSASSLVVEISSGNTIDWNQVLLKISFYILLLATCLSCIYQVAIYRIDSQKLNGMTSKQFEAVLRNEVVEEAARHAKSLIKKGKLSELEEATNKFKKLFGEGK